MSHDPIGLLGGENQFQYAPNPVEWGDLLGWARLNPSIIKTLDAQLQKLGINEKLLVFMCFHQNLITVN